MRNYLYLAMNVELVVLAISLVVLLLIVKQFVAADSGKSHKAEKKVKSKAEQVKYFTKEEVAKHNSETDCWLIVNNKVYDVTPYVEDHVGGPESISKNAGFDNTQGFHGKQHPEKVTQMIEEYYIGELKQ